tara:strand:+ start:867 stop:1766 length:900 start_codon:yes stop_codon:yes gene_type:complete
MPYIGTSPSNGVRRVYSYTATASQTTFSGASTEGQTLAYTDSTYIDVYQNGVLLDKSDYTSTNGTQVVLAQGASADDVVVIIVYDVFSVADTVSKSDGGTFDGAVTVSGNFTSSGTITGNAFSGDGSGLSGVGITGWSNNGTNNDLLPASASAGIYLGVNSATASNLLHDYEEGSWTPSLSGVSSHSTQVGRYVKVGNIVTAHAHVAGVITGSGSITVSGLPFSSNSTTNMQQSMSVGFSSYIKFTSASMLAMTARIAPDATEFGLLRYRHNNNGDGVQRGDQDGDSVTLLIGGTYITD